MIRSSGCCSDARWCIRRARGYAPLPGPSAGTGPADAGRRGAFEERHRYQRGSQLLHQPAHRRPRDDAGDRGVRTGDCGVPRSLPCRARRRRSPICIPTTSRPGTPTVSACPSCASSITSRTWPPAWRRTSSTTRCLASRGTAPATAQTARSGAASFSCRAAIHSTGSRRCGPFACPAANARSANRGGRPSACCTRSTATTS